MQSNNSGNPVPPSIWVGQVHHLVCILLLLAAVFVLWMMLEQPHPKLFWLAVLTPVFHQIFVWLAWRVELNSSGVSKSLGFKAYLALFFLFFGARYVTLTILAWLDRGSLGMGDLPRTVIASILIVVGLYAMYSVKRYFGLARAAGGDHFALHYRELPLVKEGIFRFTENGMYLYAFLLFWAIAFGFNSSAALAVAAFSHIYIWVHFYTTEKPDMDYLYAPVENS